MNCDMSILGWLHGKLANYSRLNCLGFHYKCLLVSCGDISFKKILGQVLAGKSSIKVTLLTLGTSGLLKTNLLRDMVGCDIPL
jgi:hypothetical protein